jgi:hypothetical protein
LTETLDGAAHAFLCRLFARAEHERHVVRGLPFKIAQQQCVTVQLAQLTQRGVQVRGDMFPDDFGFGGKQFVHGGGLLFAGATPHIGADDVGGEVLRRAVQPAGEDRTIHELPRILCESHKHTLSHVLGQVRIANHAQGSGIDKVNVPSHEFGKRRLRAALRVIAQ